MISAGVGVPARDVPLFHHDVSRRQEQHRALPVSRVYQQSNIIGVPATSGPRGCVPQNKKDGAMGLFTKDIKTMDDLFVHQLQDIYYP